MAGPSQVAEIARFATTFTPAQRRRLHLPRKHDTQRSCHVLGYGRFDQLLTRMAPDAFATLLAE